MKQALNFRRTYFLFIDFLTALFLGDNVPRQTRMAGLIGEDRKRKNIRELCHRYVLYHLLIHYEREKQSRQEKLCNRVNRERFKQLMQGMTKNTGTRMDMTEQEFLTMSLFES